MVNKLILNVPCGTSASVLFLKAALTSLISMVQAAGAVSSRDGETIQLIPDSGDVFRQGWCYIQAGALWQGKYPSPESPWEPQAKKQSLTQVRQCRCWELPQPCQGHHPSTNQPTHAGGDSQAGGGSMGPYLNSLPRGTAGHCPVPEAAQGDPQAGGTQLISIISLSEKNIF